MNYTKAQLFKRQITLAEIGKIGQQKLQDATVLIAGCGGLGGSVAVYLAASGVGNLHLVDFDRIDSSNLHRQVFFSLVDVGRSKAEVLAHFIRQRSPYTTVTFHNTTIAKNNVFDLISEVDIVVDATDSLATKYLLNDACVLKNKPLVYGSLYKFDGYVSVFNALQKDGTFSANLRDAFPKMANDIPTCEEAGTLNAIVGAIAMLQVNEVIKLITAIGKNLTNQLLVYNSLQNTHYTMKLTSKATSQAARQQKISELFESETYTDGGCEIKNNDWLISAAELKKELSGLAKNRPIIISVLENLKPPFSIDYVIPIQKINIEEFKFDSTKKYVLVCQKGITSYKAITVLKNAFSTANIVSLEGGINNF